MSLGGAPFDKRIEFTQPDGTVVLLHGRGDEFYAVFETLQGYTVVFDPALKAYCYARLALDGGLESTGLQVHRFTPVQAGVVPHLRMSQEARRRMIRERFDRWDEGVQIRKRWSERKAAAQLAESARASGAELAPPAYITTGIKVGLTVLVDFSDAPATVPQTEILNFCNSDSYTGSGNNGSVKSYFYDNSGGLLTYTNVVTIYIRAPQPKSYYNDTTKDCGVQGNLLIRDIIARMKALPNYYTEILPTFASLTTDASSRVVALNVFYAGNDGGVWSKGVWPHSWSLYNVGAQALGNGMSVFQYQITNIGSSVSLGTFCHENGHMLCDYPDIYDYDYDSSGGAGMFCLMNSGGSGGNPTQICAYLKRASGWATTVELNSASQLFASLSAPAGPGFNRFYRFQKPGVPTEYFLIENRQRANRDARLPGSGIAIWHVDELGDHDDQRIAYNTLHQNYEVTLVQADNLFHLQDDKNSGDASDLFFSGNTAAAYRNVFSDTSAPSARWWDGSNSGLYLDRFSASGATMTFRVGQGPPALSVAQIRTSDANGNGQTDYNETNTIWIVLRNDGVETATNVAVTLSTTVPGVILVAPTSPFDDIAPGAMATILSPLVLYTDPTFVCGTPIILSAVASCTGRTTTNSVSLPSAQGQVATAANSAAVPTVDLASVYSTNLVSGFSGQVAKVVVRLHLAHTYDRDLTVSLIGPDQTTVTLIDRRGASGDNFGTSCSLGSQTVLDDAAAQLISSGSAPFVGAYRPEQPLSAFAGKSGSAVNGPWTLQVRDGSTGDGGELRCWSVEVFSPATCVDGALQPPIVALSPNHGTIFPAGAPILLSAAASDPDGVVTAVQFYDGQELLASALLPPFEFVWTNAATGSHTLSARALDDSGLFATAAAVIGVADAAGPLRWVGGASSNRWSEPFNWSLCRVPTNGEPLLFAGSDHRASTNDFLLTAGPVRLTAGGYSLGGTPLTLAGGIVNDGDNSWGLPARLGTSQTFSNQSGTFALAGAVTNNGYTLTLDGPGNFGLSGLIVGSGGLTKNGSGTLGISAKQPYTGSTTVNAGTVVLSIGGNTGALRGILTVQTNATVQCDVPDALGFGPTRVTTLHLNQGTLLHAGPGFLPFWGMNVNLTGSTIRGLAQESVLDIGTDSNSANTPSVINSRASTLASSIEAPQLRLRQLSTDFNVEDGPAEIDLEVEAAIVSVLANSGIVKKGLGTMRLTSTNHLSGQCSVNAGTLRIDGTLGTNAVNVNSGGTLTGNGIIGGRLNVYFGGTLQPGPGLATLTGSNTVFLSGTTLLNVSRKNAALANSRISTGASIAYGGGLEVYSLGDSLEEGDAFQLFEATNYSGSFATMILPQLDPGLAWNLASLRVNGAITVASIPRVVLPPTDLTVTNGDPAVFAVGAAGSAPLVYQWRKDGLEIATATNSSLVIPAATLADAGGYDVIVSNAVGSVTSVVASLVVYSLPTFVNQPAAATVAAGSNAVFEVSLAGNPAPALQWFHNDAPLSGQTAPVLVVANAQPGDSGVYFVLASNLVGAVSSLPATLTVVTLPVITAEPADLLLAENEPGALEVAAEGLLLAYQWRKDGASIPNATEARLRFPSATTNDIGNYDVVVSNLAGSVASRLAAVSVSPSSPPPTLTIRLTNDVIWLSWPTNVPGFALQNKTNLLDPVWQILPEATNGTWTEVLEPQSSRFFRLIKP